MNTVLLVFISVLFFFGVVAYNRVFLKRKIGQYIKIERKRQESVNHLRQEMARDFHDEMGNHLASIISMVTVLKLKLCNEGPEICSILDKVEIASKNLFGGTREFMWTIDPDHDNLADILLFLRDYGVNFFHNTNIEFEASHELLKHSEIVWVMPGTSRHIIAIFKEAI